MFIKVRLPTSKKNCFVCFNESPSKMIKNAFYFILKTVLVLKIFKFLSYVEKTADAQCWFFRKGSVNSFSTVFCVWFNDFLPLYVEELKFSLSWNFIAGWRFFRLHEHFYGGRELSFVKFTSNINCEKENEILKMKIIWKLK